MADKQEAGSGTQAQLSALGQVMGELVHDLSNEITVLQGWALLARGELEAGRLPASEVQRVVEISDLLAQMLRDVLAALAGQAVSPEVRFDPLAVTEETLGRRVRGMTGLTVRLQSQLPPAGVEVAGRSSFWARALSNLLGNAARHARREIGVSLRVEAAQGSPTVVLRVEDDGPGVESGQREAIFRPFWRGERGGSGLGLSAVSWSVAQLRGEVGYRADSVLGGAAFEVRVPAAVPLLVRRPAVAEVEVESLAGTRVLVVDDEPGVLQALGRLLERAGVEVRELNPVGEPEERLLSAIVSVVPDVILLDLRLGERGGLSLWRRLGAQLPSLAGRVIFVSGAAPGEADWEAALLSGQPVLAKPFSLRQLAGVVRQLDRSG